jgi:hypothetical protein
LRREGGALALVAQRERGGDVSHPSDAKFAGEEGKGSSDLPSWIVRVWQQCIMCGECRNKQEGHKKDVNDALPKFKLESNFTV